MFSADNVFFGLNLTFLLIFAILAALIFISMSGFIKINIIINLLKNAIGAQQVPSNLVVNLLSGALAWVVISPHVSPAFDRIYEFASVSNDTVPEMIIENYEYIFSEFIMYSKEKAETSPFSMKKESLPEIFLSGILGDVIDGLKIGIKLYIVFLVIDLVLAVVLSACGMTMLSPTIISIPIKLGVFYYAEGWNILIQLVS